MSTNVVSAKDIKREKHTIDAGGKVLGRLATEIAKILMGKNKPSFVPYLDAGDYVVVTNASQVKVTGKKMQDKVYTRHSGYPGGLKVETFDKVLLRKPESIIEHAVKGMLPHNKLGRQMIKKLKVFAGEAK
ncbi:50S ribosomal protein L13 [Candidatus Daviesbacteria bacterium]|nr:50S ribosomal protein L13 [Candidatus Daviesbacteria bacterium]